MSLRDEIAKTVIAGFIQQDTTENIADAILATIKASVPPLVWVAPSDGTYHDIDCRYEIDQEGRYFRLIKAVTGGGGYLGHFPTLEAAQAAAQAHHVAQKTDWMMGLSDAK